MKSEIRNPKSERSPNSEVRIRTSTFGLPSDFGIGNSGFTLVEVILALAISAVVLAAICGVFTGAVRLREKTTDSIDTSLPLTEAMDVLRRDLLGAVGPSNILAGDFKCGGATMGENMGLSSSEGLGLNFFTATGMIKDEEPWGDIQEVYYQLAPPADRNQPGKDLVRYVNRNLLSTTTPTPDKQWLAGNIANVQFDCYDGLQWRNIWDTSMGDTNLPTAVRVRIQLAQDANGSTTAQPLEMIVPLVSHSRTNHVTTVGGL
jgi:prepilin-type N-terminal cleavage/methylation domain-containing protein